MKNALLLLFALISLLSSCSKKKHFYVQANGAEFLNDIGSDRSTSQDSPFAPMSVYRPADVLIIDIGHFMIMDDRKDQILEVRNDSNYKAFINGKLVSLFLDSGYNKILSTLSHDEIQGLKSITLDLVIGDSIVQKLSTVAKINSNINLIQYQGSLNNMDKLLELFSPKLLYTTLSEKDLRFLENEQQLTHLTIMIDDSTIVSQPLPKIDKLTHLVVQTESSLTADFLKNNPQLTDLAIYGYSDSNILKPLRQLKSLTLFDGSISTLTDRQKSQIERLEIGSDTSLSAEFFKPFNNLSWLYLPRLEMQSAFDSITLSHPDIEVIGLPSDGKITDFSKATNWKKLRTMMLYGDSLENRKGLEKLTNLKLLTFPFTEKKDSVYLEKLRKALPDTTILPNDGVCVGSIWLLLVFPIVLIIRTCYRITTN